MTTQHDELGPLASLVGTWEGEGGHDVSPSNTDRQPTISKYRERMIFEPTGRVDNHEQVLFGLRYQTVAWRIGADEPFHEDRGYFMWDAENRQVWRAFTVPRGNALIAGGTTDADAKTFSMEAKLGDPCYGICSNKFLDKQFQTVRYTLSIKLNDDGSFTYEQNTMMKMPGRESLFEHTDTNTLRKVE